jgi:hypothetical protein
MELETLAARLGTLVQADRTVVTTHKCGSRLVLQGGRHLQKAQCDNCGAVDRDVFIAELEGDNGRGDAGGTDERVSTGIDLHRNGQRAEVDVADARGSNGIARQTNGTAEGHSNGNGQVVHIEDGPAQAIASAKYALSFEAKQWAEDLGFRRIYPDNKEFHPIYLEHLVWAASQMPAFRGLSKTDLEEELLPMADAYVPLPVEPEERLPAIITENYELATAANERYLSRREIVERLCYAESISLAVGGKHHGKSTAVRTEAMSIARGVPFLGRETTQGHVIYAASAEEVPVARMELLRMGWDLQRDALSLVYENPDADDKEEERNRVLYEIANLAVRRQTVFIVLDMLFDFARIKDEMSYANTREAIGKIQKLADITKAHVLATHHSPKYMLDTAAAATAALGSQGIAARFSPIMLSRSWGEQIYTIESTMTRDPRGLALPQMLVEKDENGWIQNKGEFKDWMKWKLYQQKILDLMDAGEPEDKYSVYGIAAELKIAKPHIQNAMKRMAEIGILGREKHGRGFHYWRITGDEADTTGTNRWS